MTTAPTIEVGILFAPKIHFRLNGNYTMSHTEHLYSGDFSIYQSQGDYYLENNSTTEKLTLPVTFIPSDPTKNDFDLQDVVIGIKFHWERTENQKFKGSLKIIEEIGHLTAINQLSLEEYLLSVISSEMNASSPIELLKAHAVISRSWLLAQKEKAQNVNGNNYHSCISTENEYIRWYDREDHEHFDVCADDHCQRYQGISKAYTPTVKEAMQNTYGEVLTYQDKICDARFSKCCGGMTERFENTWEPVGHPYLEKVRDSALDTAQEYDLSNEQQARQWILSSPEAFCHTNDSTILSAVLNDYDLETQHFFRWTVRYSQKEISALVYKRSGIDFGTIEEILPLERGTSGRIIRLRIRGDRKTMTVGKELFIRKIFSETHLYSSAFIVEKENGDFVFQGAGWGHGVGLCQIGAAVMSAQGYSYREILNHYFPGSKIEKIY